MAQDRGGLGGVHVELLRDRLLERSTAPVEDACELARAAAGDEQRRRLVPDRDDDGRGVVRGTDGAGLDECAQQAERLEIDACEPETRLLADLQVRLDLVAGGDDEQDATDRLALLARALVDHAVVEHRLVHRDRQAPRAP